MTATRLHVCPYCLGTGHIGSTACWCCHGTAITDSPPWCRVPEVEPVDPRSVARDGDW